MTGAAPARPGAGSVIAEWGFSPSGLRLSNSITPGRYVRGRVDGIRNWYGSVGSISGDAFVVGTPVREMFDLGTKVARRCVIRFTVNVGGAGTGSGFVLGQHYIAAGTNTNFVYQYNGGDGIASSQGIRMDNTGDSRIVAVTNATSTGVLTFEIRWFWPEVEVYNVTAGNTFVARTMLTGTGAQLSQGTLFGPRGSGSSPTYQDIEVWAAPPLWRFARNPIGG